MESVNANSFLLNGVSVHLTRGFLPDLAVGEILV